MEKDLKNIQKLAKMLDGHQLVTMEEFRSAVSDFINAFAQHRSAFKELSTKNEETLNTSLKNLQDEFSKMRSDMDGGMSMTKSEMSKMMDKCMSDMKDMCDEMESRLPKDGEDGLDADEEKIIQEVLSKLPETKEETPNEEVDKINQATNQIKKERIEGLEQAIMNSASNAVNALPPTTSLINSKRAKNLNFSGATVNVVGDTANVTITPSVGTFYVETPNEAIDGARVAFTVDNTITTVLSVHINGQFIHPVDYSVAGVTITFGTAPDISYASLPFTVVYT